MQKQLIFLLFTAITFLSCETQKSNKANVAHQTITATSNSSLNNDSKLQTNGYCKLTLGSHTEEAEYDLRSSNALRKGTVTTTFNIDQSDRMYDKYPLGVAFSKVESTLDPKLKVGTYDIKTISLEAQDPLSFFSINGDIITEEMYEEAKKNKVLDDLVDSYVLLQEATNAFKIVEVKDIGDVEKSQYYTTGKQQVKGMASVRLLNITTNEKMTIKVDFDVVHEWSMSK